MRGFEGALLALELMGGALVLADWPALRRPPKLVIVGLGAAAESRREGAGEVGGGCQRVGMTEPR